MAEEIDNLEKFQFTENDNKFEMRLHPLQRIIWKENNKNDEDEDEDNDLNIDEDDFCF